MIPNGVWLLGSATGLLALTGLFMAAGARDGAVYLFGLSLFGFGVLFIFGLLKYGFDEDQGSLS